MRVLAGSAETCIGSILRVLERIFYSKSFFSLRIFNIVKQSIKLIYLFHIPKLGEFWDVTKCVFIGYPKEICGYPFYQRTEGKGFGKKNVSFFEKDFLSK